MIYTLLPKQLVITGLNGETGKDNGEGGGKKKKEKKNVRYNVYIHETWVLWNVEPDLGFPLIKEVIGDDNCGQSEFPEWHIDFRKV